MKGKRFRLFILTILSFVVSAAPLAAILFFKRGEYFKTVEETFKIAAGGGMLAVFLLIKIVGRFKMPRGIVLYGMIFGLSWLLEALLADLMLLSGAALLGEFLDWSIFRWQIRRIRENITIEKNAKATAAAMEPVMKKISGRV